MNLFSSLPQSLPQELVDVLATGSNVRIERIVSHGHASPPEFWYDQEEHEWVVVLQGAARLALESEVMELRSGDFVHIPAHRRHRVDWTTPAEPTVWLAVFWRE